MDHNIDKIEQQPFGAGRALDVPGLDRLAPQLFGKMVHDSARLRVAVDRAEDKKIGDAGQLAQIHDG